MGPLEAKRITKWPDYNWSVIILDKISLLNWFWN